MDCLFIHVPRARNWYRPLGEYQFITIIPSGLLALARHLEQGGFSTKVLHLGQKEVFDPGFSLGELVETGAPRVAAFDLQWHHQAADVLDVAESLKARFPRLFILLGGMTASFFAREILESHHAIDGVIRGDGEAPLLGLMRRLGGSLEEVPNLSHRVGGGIVENEQTYVERGEELDALDFTDFTPLEDREQVTRYLSRTLAWRRAATAKENVELFTTRFGFLSLPAGRGCSGICPWCAGSALSQKAIAGRRGAIFRAPSRVVDSIARALTAGWRGVTVSDVDTATRPEYLRELLGEIRRSKIRPCVYLDCRGLPGLEELDAFGKAAHLPHSALVLSPDTGDDELRRRLKGPYSFSNAQLEACLEAAREREVRVELFFALGAPWATVESDRASLRFAESLRRRYDNVVAARAYPLVIEPGSPWHVDPERYGIVTSRRSFHDFRLACRTRTSFLTDPGYYIPGYAPSVSDERSFAAETQRLRCELACFLSPHLTQEEGRRMCEEMAAALPSEAPDCGHLPVDR